MRKTDKKLSFLKMFSAANILPLVLQSDCKGFGSVRQSVAITSHTLEDMSNDVNSIHFRSSRNFCAKYTPKRKVKQLNNERKIPRKAGKPFLKLLQSKRNSISSLNDSSAEYNLSLWKMLSCVMFLVIKVTFV